MTLNEVGHVASSSNEFSHLFHLSCGPENDFQVHLTGSFRKSVPNM